MLNNIIICESVVLVEAEVGEHAVGIRFIMLPLRSAIRPLTVWWHTAFL